MFHKKHAIKLKHGMKIPSVLQLHAVFALIKNIGRQKSCQGFSSYVRAFCFFIQQLTFVGFKFKRSGILPILIYHLIKCTKIYAKSTHILLIFIICYLLFTT